MAPKVAAAAVNVDVHGVHPLACEALHPLDRRLVEADHPSGVPVAPGVRVCGRDSLPTTPMTLVDRRQVAGCFEGEALEEAVTILTAVVVVVVVRRLV